MGKIGIWEFCDCLREAVLRGRGVELERIGDFRVCGLKRGRLRRGLEGVLGILLWGIRRAWSRIFIFCLVVDVVEWREEERDGSWRGEGIIKEVDFGIEIIKTD